MRMAPPRVVEDDFATAAAAWRWADDHSGGDLEVRRDRIRNVMRLREHRSP